MCRYIVSQRHFAATYQ